MKKILIGRGAGNDIRLKDESDRVSRRQAVIEVSPFGKMRIHDTSSNGTFVNGERVEKPGGRDVKRGDKVDFAHVMELDWNLVKDPYKGMKIAIGVFVVALIAAAVLFFVFSDELLKKEKPVDPEPTEQVEATDTTSTVQDTVSAEQSQAKSQAPAKKTKKQPKKNSKDKKKPDSKDPNKNGIKEIINPAPDPNGLKPDNGPKTGGTMKNEKK